MSEENLLNPRLVGAWNGTHIWLQWDGKHDSKYEVRIRFRDSLGQDWEDWRPTIQPERTWFTYLARRAIGTMVQAQVRDVSSEDWQTAMEAIFIKSLCKFEFSTQRKPIHFPENVKFHCVVDGAACSYQLLKELEIDAGESRVVEMEALASDAFAQLDNENDFLIRPALGVTIRNIEPSTNDLEVKERDFTLIARVRRDGPFSLAFLPSQNVR